jgi:hypothetical protein
MKHMVPCCYPSEPEDLQETRPIDQEFAAVVAALLAGRIDGQQAVASLTAIHNRAVLALPQVAELRGKTRDFDSDLFAQIDAVLGSGDYGNVTDRLVEFVTAREAGLRGKVERVEALVKALADEWAAEGDEMSHWFAAQVIYDLLDQSRAALASDPTTHESEEA